MGLFAKGDGHYSQGQRPWLDAQRAVFAKGDGQTVGVSVVIHPSACQLFFDDQRDTMRLIEYGLWPNALGGGRIPGAMPLAMLDMASGHGFVRQRRCSL